VPIPFRKSARIVLVNEFLMTMSGLSTNGRGR
jgi:hypothetical protein